MIVAYRRRGLLTIENMIFPKIFSVLLMLFLRQISSNDLSQLTISRDESAGKCAMEIANKYFVADSPNINMFLINSSRDCVLLSLLYQSQNHVKTLRDLKTFKVNYYDIKRRFAIVAAESLEELISYSYQFSNLNLWNARAQYIFIIRNKSVNKIQQIVDLLWDKYIINALVMIPSKHNETIQEIHAWFPYENGLCGQNISARVIDVCEDGQFQENADLFPLKVPDVVNKCPIRARAVIWAPLVMPPDDKKVIDNVPLNITQGVEVMLLKTAAQFMNINMIFTSSTIKDNWGIATADGNTTGNIRAVHLKEIEMSFGAYGPMLERRMFLDFTTSHYFDVVTWCVPRAQLTPKWRSLLNIFQYNTWLSMIGAYLSVSTIVCCVCSCQPRDKTSYVYFKDSLNFLFSTFLAVSVCRTPNKLSGRIVFFVWIVFSFHFVVAYQAKLISVLLNPTYEKQMDSIEEILKSGIEWAALPSMTRFFNDTRDWRVREINRNWKTCSDADACLRRIAIEKDFAFILVGSHAKYEALNYLDANLESMIYCLPEAYLVFPSEMYVNKGFPLLTRLNNLILQIKEAGFIVKWKQDLEYKQIIKQLRTVNEKYPREIIKKLTLDHLQGAFMILGLGIVSAIFAFSGELISYKVKEIKIRKSTHVQRL